MIPVINSSKWLPIPNSYCLFKDSLLAIAVRREDERWWVLLLWGFTSIMVGILTFLMPGITALALLLYIAIWAIATGVLEIVVAIRLRREIRGECLLILGGIASVLFGAFLVAKPGAGALTLLWMIAAYAVIFGVVLIILAFKVRTFGNRVAHHKTEQ